MNGQPTTRCEDCDPSFTSCWNDGSKCCKRPKQLTPTQRASTIFEAYRSDDRLKWEPAYDEVVSIIAERDQLKRQVEELNRENDKANEIADAMTDYAGNEAQQIKLIVQLRAQNAELVKACKRTLQYLRQPDDCEAEYIERVLSQAIDEAQK